MADLCVAGVVLISRRQGNDRRGWAVGVAALATEFEV
jgi:hypothetical protein